MDLQSFKSYPAKILLFGEYLVLQGGSALAIPHSSLAMCRSHNSNITNKAFFSKIHDYLCSNSVFKDRIKPQFQDDIEIGLQYDSSIPVGYGLGSSGALVAALYDTYIENKATDYKLLQSELAEMEGFFHDKSSGIDPLTSYLQVPILSHNENIEIFPELTIDNYELIDSGIRRNAREAIMYFNQQSLDCVFQKKLTELTELSNEMIRKSIQKENIQNDLFQFSSLQLILFSDFIPENMKLVWKQGLNSRLYNMKLCGAGMGGMFLKFKTI